jgi:putative ABC exporter
MTMWRRLLASRARIWIRSLAPRRRGGRRPGVAWIGLGLALALGTLVYLALVGVFQTLAAGPGTPQVGVTLLALVLGTAFAGLIVFDLHDAVSTLVSDSDLALLRRAPIAPGTMLALKLVDAMPRTVPAVAGIALPAVLAYWSVYPPPPWAWLLLPPVIAALWAIPLGLGVATALLLLNLVPARRAREGLAMLATVTLLGVWVVNALVLPRLADFERTTGDWARALEGVGRAAAFSPGFWAARALTARSHGDVAAAWVAIAELAAAAVASLALARLAADRLLDGVQARVAVPGAARRRRRRPRPPAEAPAVPRPLLRAVIQRDARLYARDWATLADVLTATVLWTLLPLVAAPLFEAPVASIARVMLLALTVGLGYEIAARAIPLERRGLAWMRLAPVSGRAWMLARYISAGALAVTLFAFGAFATVGSLGVGESDLLELLALTVPALALALATGLWSGAAFGDPDWRSARGMLTLPGRMASSALLLAQAAGWLSVAGLADAHRDALPAFTAVWLPTLLAVPSSLLLLDDAARRLQRPSN